MVKRLLAGGVLALLIVSVAAGASVLAQPINSDPYTNASSDHKTQVEPDSFAYGSTIVSVIQTGRFFDGGASNIAWSTSQDGGRTWAHGTLPGTTQYSGGPYARISDPAVAYDPSRGVWMISGLAFGLAPPGKSPEGSPSAILTSRSTDGGLTWQNPVTTSFGQSSFYDKNWIACDTWAASPHYGNCYTEWDDNGQGNLLQMSTSIDGGLHWSPATAPADSASGLGGQPVVQPNGDVIVPYSANDAAIRSFRSTDGGLTWSASTLVSPIESHNVAGNLRTSPLPSAEVSADGTVYVAWQDCRFRAGCTANDIVYSASTDGLVWSTPTRIPIDDITSTVDHFIPGLAVDRSTSGSTTHLALGYYYYPNRSCTPATCQLTAGFVSSNDNGASWTQPLRVAGPMNLSWLPNTSQGRMVGDYMSTSFTSDGKAHPIYAIAKAPTGSVYQEQMATATFTLMGSITGPVRAQLGKPVAPRRSLPLRHRLVTAR